MSNTVKGMNNELLIQRTNKLSFIQLRFCMDASPRIPFFKVSGNAIPFIFHRISEHG